MRAPRFFATGLPSEPGDLLALEGEEATHLARVLRLKPGAEVEVFDGAGGAGRFKLDAVDRRRALLRLERRTDDDRELPFVLVLAVAPPKPKRAQRLVEALTELGVTRLHALTTERGQNRAWRTDEVERWALEASKQCGRNRLLEPGDPLDLQGLLREAALADLALVGDVEEQPDLRGALTQQPPTRVVIGIGPEGGFSEAERGALLAGGLRPVRLGRTILRVETAATALVALMAASA